MEALSRIRDMFAKQPIFRDGAKPPRVYFDITDFTNPVHAQAITDIASSIIDAMPLAQADAIVSIADRASGAIAHEAARLSELPYTLANWYPEGTSGEVEVEPCGGFSGSGHVWLNGLKRNRRVVVILDILRSGHTAANIVRACNRAGCQVLAVGFGVELVEFGGRKQDAFDNIPLHATIRLHVRGERTSEVKDSETIFGPSVAQLLTRRLKEGAAQNAMSSTDLGRIEAALNDPGCSVTTIRAAITATDPTKPLRLMPSAEVDALMLRVTSPFIGMPIMINERLNGYPYTFFQLTDFTPLLTPDVVEAAADLAVHLGSFSRCDVIVAEADRGGAPLAVAISRRTKLPFVLASWYPLGAGIGASTKVSVGYSGDGEIVLNGIRRGDRCIFVDDMISTGATAAGAIESIMKLGGIPVQGVFASEKLYPAKTAKGLPVRRGKDHLEALHPQFEVITLAQFLAEGARTTAPHGRIG
jgi:adenine/guanine phosphoribosyltransferase-like PRPP-binding protein